MLDFLPSIARVAFVFNSKTAHLHQSYLQFGEEVGQEIWHQGSSCLYDFQDATFS